MRKFLSVLILIAALIVGGCESESFSVTSVNGDIHVEGENCNGSIGKAELDIDGGALVGDAKITSGRVEVQKKKKLTPSTTADKFPSTCLRASKKLLSRASTNSRATCS